MIHSAFSIPAQPEWEGKCCVVRIRNPTWKSNNFAALNLEYGNKKFRILSSRFGIRMEILFIFYFVYGEKASLEYLMIVLHSVRPVFQFFFLPVDSAGLVHEEALKTKRLNRKLIFLPPFTSQQILQLIALLFHFMLHENENEICYFGVGWMNGSWICLGLVVRRKFNWTRMKSVRTRSRKLAIGIATQLWAGEDTLEL